MALPRGLALRYQVHLLRANRYDPAADRNRSAKRGSLSPPWAWLPPGVLPVSPRPASASVPSCKAPRPARAGHSPPAGRPRGPGPASRRPSSRGRSPPAPAHPHPTTLPRGCRPSLNHLDQLHGPGTAGRRHVHPPPHPNPEAPRRLVLSGAVLKGRGPTARARAW